MKKAILILLVTLLSASPLLAQSTDALSNATIIKMVKGKLSDDLIIDEINNSKVNFDLSSDGIKALSAANVSDHVIQAMKTVDKIQNPSASLDLSKQAAVAKPDNSSISPTETSVALAVSTQNTDIKKETPEQSQPQESVLAASEATPKESNIEPSSEKPAVTGDEISSLSKVPDGETASQPTAENFNSEAIVKKLKIETLVAENGTSILIEQPVLTVETLSYVHAVADLIPFYNTQFSSFSAVILDWDKKLKASLEKEKQSIAAIAKIEKELTSKKNADSKLFGKEITDQQKSLLAAWEKHKTLKSEMVSEGKALAEVLKKISKDTESAIDTKYKEVSRNVKSAEPDPSKRETAKAIKIPKQKFYSTVTGYFAPTAMMLVCYQNEIIALQKTIETWNEKALVRIKKDAELKIQLDPLQAELSKYQAGTKQDQKLKKKEISALKKQCDALEKERKQLAKQMADDSTKLSEEINKMKTEAQSVVLERFADIIESIEHTYQDKFNL